LEHRERKRYENDSPETDNNQGKRGRDKQNGDTYRWAFLSGLPIQPREIPGRILTEDVIGDDKLLSDKY